jgi:uncharacterized protein (TIGR03083 family)
LDLKLTAISIASDSAARAAGAGEYEEVMTSLDELRTATEICFAKIEALCTDLDNREWQVQSLCPEWDVRAVVNHVTGVEAALAGWLPTDSTTPPPLEKTVFVDPGASISEFVAAVRQVYQQRRQDLAELTSDDLDRPSWTPIGPTSYGQFLAIRIFDLWVHERDIAIPLGGTTEDGGIAAEITLAEVERSIGYIVGKKIGLPDGTGITFRLTGPIERDISVMVDGKARRVDQLADPDVTVTADSTTFILLACGRIDPQASIDAGDISWVGDAELGDRAARNLRYTI